MRHSINVRLVGGPADGQYVVVPTGVSVWRIAEMPKLNFLAAPPDEPIDLMVRTHEYVLGREFPHRGYFEGVWQG